MVDDRLGIPPLFETYTVPAAYSENSRPLVNEEREPLGLDSDNSADIDRWMLRPFIYSETQGEDSNKYVLWPLYRRSRIGPSSKDWLLPLWYRARRVTETGGVDSDQVIFPIFFWGNDPSEGSYFLFFPFGGTLKGILGQDRSDWFLFPLYVHAQDRWRHSRHLLWPIFNWIDSPHQTGWRFFPFYGHYTAHTPEGTKKYDRRFYLWPFFHSQENNLDTDRPVNSWWIFPFFGRIRSENLTRYSILWPLYTFVREGNSTTVALPVLPIIWSRGPNLEQTDLWPIFGLKRSRTPSGSSYRQYFLWPFQRYEYSAVGTTTQESYWFTPFFSHHRYADNAADRERSVTQLWPICSWRRRLDGQREFRLLDLLPFQSLEFDELYSRIWQLYRSVDYRDSRGWTWELLWGALGGGASDEGSSFSLLGGLFGWSPEKWRLFYFSF